MKEEVNFISYQDMKEDLQKLLSKADADKFAIYAESISKDETADSSIISDSKLVIHITFIYQTCSF